MPQSRSILVFDSGLGGLTVLREIVAARPEAHFIYVADDAFFPYGHHSEDEIIELTEAAALGASLARLDIALAAIGED